MGVCTRRLASALTSVWPHLSLPLLILGLFLVRPTWSGAEEQDDAAKVERDDRLKQARERVGIRNGVSGTQAGRAPFNSTADLAYMSELQLYVKQAWLKVQTDGADKKTVVLITLEPDGAVTGVKVDKSSGDRAYDDQVVGAVRGASPFPAPPPEAYPRFKEIRFIFDGRGNYPAGDAPKGK